MSLIASIKELIGSQPAPRYLQSLFSKSSEKMTVRSERVYMSQPDQDSYDARVVSDDKMQLEV